MVQAMANITPKWQIYLPLNIRQSLGLKSPLSARLSTQGEKIVITPQKSRLLAMAGKYQKLAKNKKIDIDNIRDIIDYS